MRLYFSKVCTPTTDTISHLLLSPLTTSKWHLTPTSPDDLTQLCWQNKSLYQRVLKNTTIKVQTSASIPIFPFFFLLPRRGAPPPTKAKPQACTLDIPQSIDDPFKGRKYRNNFPPLYLWEYYLSKVFLPTRREAPKSRCLVHNGSLTCTRVPIYSRCAIRIPWIFLENHNLFYHHAQSSSIPPTTGGFPGGSGSKESACQCRRHKRPSLIPVLERPPGGGNGNPLHCSCLGNPMEREAWQATSPRGRRELDTTEWLSISHTQTQLHPGKINCSHTFGSLLQQRRHFLKILYFPGRTSWIG